MESVVSGWQMGRGFRLPTPRIWVHCGRKLALAAGLRLASDGGRLALAGLRRQPTPQVTTRHRLAKEREAGILCLYERRAVVHSAASETKGGHGPPPP